MNNHIFPEHHHKWSVNGLGVAIIVTAFAGIAEGRGPYSSNDKKANPPKSLLASDMVFIEASAW